ncbi:MAG: NAD(P)H-dependent oxidoreductase [Actinomycetota bacterium]
MRAVVVHCHPIEGSFSSAIRDAAVRGLTSAGHDVTVRDAGILVFTYPTWWSGLPAQLKGWLERVMLPGVAFTLESGRVRPTLDHVRRIVVASTYGSPWLYVKAINDNGRRTLTRALRASTGWRARCRHVGLYAMDTATDDDRREFLVRVERAVAR